MIRTEFYLGSERWKVQYFNRNRGPNEYFEQTRGLRTLVANFNGGVAMCKWEKRNQLIEKPINFTQPVYAYTSHCDPNLIVLFDPSTAPATDGSAPPIFERKKKKETIRGKLTPDEFDCNVERLFEFLCEKQGISRTNVLPCPNQYASIEYGFDYQGADEMNMLFYAEVRDPQREYNREKFTSFLLAPGLSLAQRTEMRRITVQTHHVISFRRHIQHFPIEFPFGGVEFNYIPCQNLYLEVDMTKPLQLPPKCTAFKNRVRAKEGKQVLQNLINNDNYQLCLVEQHGL